MQDLVILTGASRGMGLAMARQLIAPGRPLLCLSRQTRPELNELAITWFGLVAPAKTPAAVVERLNAAAVAALKDPALQSRLKELGVQPIGNTPAQFGQTIASSLERVRKVVQVRKIEAE